MCQAGDIFEEAGVDWVGLISICGVDIIQVKVCRQENEWLALCHNDFLFTTPSPKTPF